MKDLTRLYDRLTPQERFAAFEAAVARMDETEIEALEYSCPQYFYRLPDSEYLALKIGFFNALMQRQVRSSEIIKVMAVQALTISYEQEPEEEKSIERSKALLTAHKALEIAWQRFAERIGMGEETGSRYLNSCINMADEFIIDAIWPFDKDPILEPSEKAIEREFEMLMTCWCQK